MSIYNIFKKYLFYEKFSKIMYIIITHKNSSNQNYNKTHNTMAPQILDPPLTKENLSELENLEIS